MIDAPGHIWAYSRFDDDFNGGEWDTSETPDCAPHWPHAKYRRDDLPPTLAQAMTVPEVRGLVEALVEVRADAQLMMTGRTSLLGKIERTVNGALHCIKEQME
jgi:hypothetical protein